MNRNELIEKIREKGCHLPKIMTGLIYLLVAEHEDVIGHHIQLEKEGVADFSLRVIRRNRCRNSK